MAPRTGYITDTYRRSRSPDSILVRAVRNMYHVAPPAGSAYLSAMGAKRSSWLSLYTVIALLVAVFLAPAVDAAVCASDAPIAAAQMADDYAVSDSGDNDDADERSGDHGLCSHGHCHLCSAGPINSSAETVKPTLSENRPPFTDDYLPSYASEGLKRPPKA